MVFYLIMVTYAIESRDRRSEWENRLKKNKSNCIVVHWKRSREQRETISLRLFNELAIDPRYSAVPLPRFNQFEARKFLRILVF